jgi:tetraacyldisaccharide 4'-kinase
MVVTLSYTVSNLLMTLSYYRDLQLNQMSFSRSLERAWNRRFSWTLLFLPLSWLFRFMASLRRSYITQIAPSPSLNVPVVVVGNISVGGTGKTPLLITLVRWFQQQGYHPGVISRGYGGQSLQYPVLLTSKSLASEVGDEPLLLASTCPVVVDPNRYRAATLLVEQTNCDLILSDDGLQHYRLPRDIEIVVVDGERGFGNGQCLPAGPLREPVSRLKQVDFIVINGKPFDQSIKPVFIEKSYDLSLEPVRLRHLLTGKTCLPEQYDFGHQVHAVAGIGNPQRFVKTLEQIGLDVQLHAWPDHHEFSGMEFKFDDDLPVIITAKDAVKYLHKDNEPPWMHRVWVLDVAAKTDTVFLEKLTETVHHLKESI